MKQSFDAKNLHMGPGIYATLTCSTYPNTFTDQLNPLMNANSQAFPAEITMHPSMQSNKTMRVIHLPVVLMLWLIRVFDLAWAYLCQMPCLRNPFHLCELMSYASPIAGEQTGVQCPAQGLFDMWTRGSIKPPTLWSDDLLDLLSHRI